MALDLARNILSFFHSGSPRRTAFSLAFLSLAVAGVILEFIRRRRAVRGRSDGGSGFRQIFGQSSTGNKAFNNEPCSPNEDALIYMGRESLSEAIRLWEKAITLRQFESIDDERDKLLLRDLLRRANDLQDDANSFVDRLMSRTTAASTVQGDYMSAVVGPPEGTASYYTGIVNSRRTMSILSDDSFVSAFEDLVPSFDDLNVILREPLHIDILDHHFYQEGLKEVRKGLVSARVTRTEFLHCVSDEEFLAKLYCIRLAFSHLFTDSSKREWLIEQGKVMIGGLMKTSKKDPAAFFSAFDRLMSYIESMDTWSEIETELQSRKVPQINFYDIVLDFILMDAFDDLSRPPSSILAVAQNRFLTASFKESTLATVVWSVLKAKRARLQNSSGFIAHFYDVSEQISPTMAWGFLGTDDSLRELCYYFKDQICSFLTDIFSFRVRFTSLGELAEDVWDICKYRIETTRNRIASETLS